MNYRITTEIYKASLYGWLISFCSETAALKHKKLPVIGVNVQSDPQKDDLKPTSMQYAVSSARIKLRLQISM